MTESFIPRSISKLEQEILDLENEGSTLITKEGEEEVVTPEAKEIKKEDLSAEEATYKKRYGELRSLQQRTAEENKALREAAKNVQPSAPDPTDLEEVKAWAEANPRAAAVIRALATEQVKSTTEAFTPKFDDLDELKSEIARTKAEKIIVKAHPDFAEVTATTEFHDWAESQVQSVQSIIYDGDADEVVWAISAYKKYAEAQASDPKREAAKTVKGKTTMTEPADKSGQGRFSESQVKSMSLSEYEKNEAKIAESMASGTFIYDLSGGAR